jgi:hypothetical protein
VRGAWFSSIQALQQELAYASYLNIQSAILPPPRNRDHVASYARIINSCLTATPYLSLSVRLPIYNPSVFQASSPKSAFQTPSRGPAAAAPSTPTLVVSDSSPEPERPQNSETSLNATWEMWDLIRSMCDYNPRLTLSTVFQLSSILACLYHSNLTYSFKLSISRQRSHHRWASSASGQPSLFDTSSCPLPRLSPI